MFSFKTHAAMYDVYDFLLFLAEAEFSPDHFSRYYNADNKDKTQKIHLLFQDTNHNIQAAMFQNSGYTQKSQWQNLIFLFDNAVRFVSLSTI